MWRGDRSWFRGTFVTKSAKDLFFYFLSASPAPATSRWFATRNDHVLSCPAPPGTATVQGTRNACRRRAGSRITVTGTASDAATGVTEPESVRFLVSPNP